MYFDPTGSNFAVQTNYRTKSWYFSREEIWGLLIGKAGFNAAVAGGPSAAFIPAVAGVPGDVAWPKWSLLLLLLHVDHDADDATAGVGVP